MNNTIDSDKNKAIRRAESLLETRRRLMDIPPEQAMAQILNSKQPTALVHSFPEQDLYLMVKGIGPEDALSLLELASNNQWEYILDMELWHRDHIVIESMTRWLDLLFRADPNRAVQWTVKEKLELLELYFFKTLDIALREQDQDPSELGDGFQTFDDSLYFRFKKSGNESESDTPPISESESDADSDSDSGDIARNHREELIQKFTIKLAELDFDQYHNIMLEAIHVIPAEVEEEAYRLKNVRMAEKGFLPFEEAVGIYQPLTREGIDKNRERIIRGAGNPEERDLLKFRSSLSSTAMLDDREDLFSRAVQEVTAKDILPVIQEELATLCNRIISADQKEIREPEQLREVVQKARGYISIGLAYLSQNDSGQKEIDRPVDEHVAAALMNRYPLAWIFRAGYGQTSSLKWRAQKWHARGWFKDRGFPLTFWDEFWLGVLGGLLVKKPLFFDNYESGVIYREFMSMADIRKTRTVLDQIIAMDSLLSRMNISDFFVDSQRLLTYKNLLLTLWARDTMGLSYEFKPIEVKNFEPFFDQLFSGKPSDTGDGSRGIEEKTKGAFLNWLSEKSGLSIDDISKELRPSLESLFEEIESEYGCVKARDLDPRFVQLFALERI